MSLSRQASDTMTGSTTQFDPGLTNPGHDELIGLREALKAWKELLGSDSVLTSPDELKRFNASTCCCHNHAPAVLRPRDVQQVQSVVQIANNCKIALYPVSCGNNWGYGSAKPARDGSVVVDLSRMTRISIDEETAVTTVEPGVTQRMLHEFLRQRNLPYLVPVHGGGPQCSILGNALERGYGITPLTDHFAALTSLEAVLPDGSLYRSPFRDLAGETTAGTFKWGVGPYLDGLFSQGCFGIVVKASFRLAPAFDSTGAFVFSVGRDEGLEDVVVAVRSALRKLGAIVGSINLMNAPRVLAMSLPRRELRWLREQCSLACLTSVAASEGIAPWTGVGTLYGEPEVIRAAKRVLRRLLSPHSKWLFFADQRKVGLARRAAPLLPQRWKRKLNAVANLLDIANGQPSSVALPLAYWGVPEEMATTENPAHDGCGLLWYAPIVPMRPLAVRGLTEFVARICTSNGFPPMITLTSLSDCVFDSTIPLLFDRRDETAYQAAVACYDELFNAGVREGMIPYRYGIDTMQHVLDSPTSALRLTTRIKEAIDPNWIMSPGRYCPHFPPLVPNASDRRH